MRVVRLQAPARLGNLTFVDEADPQPGPGELLVKIHANSLNVHDSMVVSGIMPTCDGRIPLSDGAGEVIAIGSDVHDFRIGDTVVSTFWPYWLAGEMTSNTKREIPGDSIDGYAREYVCMPSHAFTKVPPGYTYLEAATLPCAGVTAWRGLVVRGQVKPGDSVLVLGTGSVSLFALQFAKAAGARVIATSSSDEKLEKLKQLGADEVINYNAERNWDERVKMLTDGCGVDHVIEVGGPATLAQSIRACKIGGHIAVIGVLTGFTAEVSIGDVLNNQTRFSGIQVGSRADQEDMIRAITVNQLRPVIDRSFPLQDIVSAFKYNEYQTHFGKVCIEL